ncbi:MAG: hypothetical protein ACI9VR_004017 [Cognaticolwellia sp.]|jgi:hypothetical protein
MDKRTATTLSGTLFALGRGAIALIPERVKRGLDDRLFYAIFQYTRVENDDMVSADVRARRKARAQGSTKAPPTSSSRS